MSNPPSFFNEPKYIDEIDPNLDENCKETELINQEKFRKDSNIKLEKEANGNKMRTYRDKNKGKKDVIIFRSNTQNKDKINKKDNSKNIKNSKENFLRPNKKIKTRELFMKKSDLKLNLKQSKIKYLKKNINFLKSKLTKRERNERKN